MSIGNYFIWPKTCCFSTRTGLMGMLNHFHLKECLSEKSEPGHLFEIFSQNCWQNCLFWGKSVTVLAGGQWVNISYDLKVVVFELEMVLCNSWTIFIWKNVSTTSWTEEEHPHDFLKIAQIWVYFERKWCKQYEVKSI